ncbi:MAG: class I SAM-dependent methyltransferase [Chloroflexota bacterium]
MPIYLVCHDRYNPLVRREIVERLLEINRGFYQSFAEPFSETRSQLQPGVLRAIQDLPEHARVLDLGCGHGALAAHLHEHGFRGTYLGLDGSEALLDRIPSNLRPPTYRFFHADLADHGWPKRIDSPTDRFDRVCAFAVLHHLPTEQLRLAIITATRGLLDPAGRLVMSVWDFLSSLRLRKRIVPWENVGLDQQDVDAEDYLLDWRQGGTGFRYVHHFSGQELRSLAAQAGFSVLAEYQADRGLGLYQVWQPSLA